jgi:TRAP-type mannitol/chloroaromatic compound transport system permease small subunit
VDRILDAIDRLSTWIGKATGVLVFFAAAVIVYEIAMRAFLNRPTTWANESTVFACCIVYMLGGAWVLREDRHVRIDVLYGRLSPRGRAILDCVTYPFFALFVVVVLWASTLYAFESVKLRETTMSPWDPPIYPMKVAMAVGLVLILVQGTANLVRSLRAAIRGGAQ